MRGSFDDEIPNSQNLPLPHHEKKWMALQLALQLGRERRFVLPMIPLWDALTIISSESGASPGLLRLYRDRFEAAEGISLSPGALDGTDKWDLESDKGCTRPVRRFVYWFADRTSPPPTAVLGGCTDGYSGGRQSDIE